MSALDYSWLFLNQCQNYDIIGYSIDRAMLADLDYIVASLKDAIWISFLDYFFWPTHPLIHQKREILKNKKLWVAP